MFRDHSLVPFEAVRLCALGLLAEGERRYGDLAGEIRHFTSRVVGPSLDLMGTSLELLRYEGLIEAVGGGQGMTDNAVLRLSPRGGEALHALLQAQLRSPLSEINRLSLLLKLRFLHHLPAAEREGQLALMAESLSTERARIEELRQRAEPGLFRDWLDHDIAFVEERVAWLRRQGRG